MCTQQDKSNNITNNAVESQNIRINSFKRVGLGNAIKKNDTSTDETENCRLHPTIDVSMMLALKEAKHENTANQYLTKRIALTGPYEVKGINPKAILKVVPADNNMDFYFNHLPYIEFVEPDLPWRYTPEAPDDKKEEKLTPWISLIACREGEFTLTQNQEGMQILKLTEKGQYEWGQIFSKAYQHAHLWAHVDTTTHKTFSRLLCPRTLIKGAKYTIFMIPTYEVGRLSGLGIQLNEELSFPLQTYAWTTEAALQEKKQLGFEFPVYYSWKFTTSNSNFYYLAKQLKTISINSLPKDIKVDVSKIGFGLDKLVEEPKTISVAMASMPPGNNYNRTIFPQEDSKLATEMQKRLNTSHVFVDNTNLLNNINEEADTTNKDPWVAPPIYGAKHILATSLEKDNNTGHPWFYELNTQVPNRIAAGLGMEVIKQNQEQLIQRAWEQVDEVMAFNQQIREKSFGINSGKDLYYNKINNLSKQTDKELRDKLKGESRDETINVLIQLLLNLSVSLDIPLNTIGTEDQKTLATLLSESGFPPELIDPSIQKLLRSFNRAGNDTANSSEVSLIKTMLENQSGIFNLDKQQAILNYKTADLLQKILENLDYYRRAAVKESLELLHFMCHYWVEALGQDGGKIDLSLLPKKGWIQKGWISSLEQKIPKNINTDNKDLTGFIYDMPHNVNDFNDFYNQYFKKYIESNNILITLYDQYKALFKIVSENEITQNEENPTPVDWETLAPKILDIVQETMTDKNIQLKNAIAKYIANSYVVNHNIDIGDNTNTDEPINELANKLIKNKISSSQHPILAHPYFAEPTYYYLNKLSSKYILPAIDVLPNNTISLFRDNRKFVESYICGLNTEMGKELFWREYPTDQRGSYFGKFWDTENTTQNTVYSPDVEHQHLWKNELGNNHRRTEPLLIFVVKGNLIKRYPDVEVYLATSMQEEEEGQIKFDDRKDERVYPELKARIAKDITLYGFRIGFDQLLAGTGRFFTFKERPGKLNFNNLNIPVNNPPNIINTIIPVEDFTSSANYAINKVAQPYIYAKHISALL